MEALKRLGGPAGFVVALSGAGIVRFLPDHRLWGWTLFAGGLLLLIGAGSLNREDLLNLLKGRPFRHGANALFYSLVVLGIVGAVDFLAARHNKRFDLTAEGAYTLSPQTIKILEGLDQDATILAFLSTAFQGRQKALDLLDEYRYHNSRITVKAIDPVRNPAEVRLYGVEQDGTVIVTTKTGEARITPSLSGGLTEQEFTNALVKATAAARPVICVTTGHGEKGIKDAGPEGLQQAADAMDKENFEVREIRLLEGDGVPADCRSVIVAGPSHAFLPPEMQALETWLRQGGRLLVLAEPRTTTGLEGLLGRYGLELGGDFIVDVNPMSRFLGGSPAAPVIYEYGTHEIAKDLEGLATIFPTVRSVRTTTPSEPDVTTETLAHTSAQSWGETGDLADRVSFDEGSDRPGPLDIAAVAVGRRETTPSTDPNTTADPNAAPAAASEARLVVYGDSDYAGNQAFLMAGNKDLFLNTIAWLNERSDLISIRPRTSAAQPVVLTEMQARLLRWYSIGALPVLAIAAGVGVWLRRRAL